MFERLLRLSGPHLLCRGCLAPLGRGAEAGLCAACWSGLVPLPEPRCPRCALSHPPEAACPDPVAWSFGDALRGIIFPELGDGLVDLPGIVAWLKQSGYDGWLVLEQDTTHKHPKDAARINLEYVQSLL